jgi:capsular polysaccharide biosynthesis protein
MILPDPDGPLLPDLRLLPGAVLVRGRAVRSWTLDAGVYDREGAEVASGRCWHSSRNAAFRQVEPHRPPDRDLPGRWLYGGVLYTHFGHVLTETLSRLWAIDHLNGVDGIAAFPLDPGGGERMAREAMALLGIDLPVEAVTGAVRVGELVVAPQAMGAGDLMGGSPEFRAFVKRRIGDRRDPSLPRRLYISRSRNRAERGSILGEQRLEALLAAEGYAIFHPQDHDLAAQAAHYASAEAIVGPDGSPFHLVAYAAGPSARVAMLKRRPGREWAMLADHLRRFGLSEVIAVEGSGGWAPGGLRRAGLSVSGEISFAAVHAALRAHGFIDGAAPWSDLTPAEREADLLRLSVVLDADLYEVRGPGQSLAHLPRRADPARLGLHPLGSYPRA